MKLLPLLLVFIMAFAASLRAQEAAVESREPIVTQAVPPTTARILGNIADGTPPPPSPPKPEFVVPATDILATTSYEQGGRIVTIQKINPIALPPPPEPAPAPALVDVAAFKARGAEFQALHPRSSIISLGATVYRFKDSPPRTLVQYRPDPGDPVTFWSSADFALIAGVHNFLGSDGATRTLFLMWSVVDTGRMAEALAARGRDYHPPDVPVFPDGPATFAFVGQAPSAEVLVPIQSLHDLYNNEYERLHAAREGRRQASIQREADLRANPPRPKNITLNYWRIEQTATEQGGAK